MIIYESYTHLNIQGTQSLVGIEYARILKCFLWFHLCKNIGRAEKHSGGPWVEPCQPLGFPGAVLHCPGWFQSFQKAEPVGAHHNTQLSVVLRDISFSLALLFYCFFLNKLPINFINLPKIGPVRYRLSISEEFGKDWPSSNAIFTQ